VTRITRC